MSRRVVVVDPDARRRQARRRRYKLQRELRKITPDAFKRVRNCKRYRHFGVECITMVRNGDGVARWAGLQSCSSVWACPVCSARIREDKGVAIEDIATKHLQSGGVIAFVTLTVRHKHDDDLADLLGRISPAWNSVGSRAAWDGIDVIGFVRSVEITRGGNGWHPHLHALVFLRTLRDLMLLRRYLSTPARLVKGSEVGVTEGQDAWASACEKAGLARPDYAGVRVQPVRLVDGRADVGQYLSKVQDSDGSSWSVGHEMTRGDLKTGRSKTSFTPFDIGSRAAGGNLGAKALWLEYITATKGKRAIEWSRSQGWKDHLAAIEADNIPDGDADDDDPQAGDVPVIELHPDEWAFVRQRRLEARLLDVAERHGQAGVLQLLKLQHWHVRVFEPWCEKRRLRTGATGPAEVPQWPS